MEHGRDVVYSRGSRWRMQFYDRGTQRFYAGSGDSAWEALAWLVSDYKRRGLEGGEPRIAFRSDATPEFPDGPIGRTHPIGSSNTLASVAVAASPHSAAEPHNFTKEINRWDRVNPKLLSDEAKRKLGLLPRVDDQALPIESSRGIVGGDWSNKPPTVIDGCASSGHLPSTEDKTAARRAKVRARLLQRKGDGS